ncbi:hypothetical protein B5E64_02515 [Drancourtella sp. An12]|nr:hypothetical protein B5E64_02515 [Drancourtella sp. An12]
MLFGETVFTEEYAAYLILLVSTVIGMVFSEELFTYFVYHEKVVKGTYLFLAYTVLTGCMMFCVVCSKNKTLLRITLSGMTPACTLLTFRWWAEGVWEAKLLVAVFALYILWLLIQAVIRKYHGRKTRHLWTKIIYKSFSVLIGLSFLGTLGYSMNRITPVEMKVQRTSSEVYGDRGWDENRRMLSMWQEDVYIALDNREKKELWQALIDLESQYWGIEPPTVEVEQYEAESERDGYYSKEDQMISVTSKAWYYSRERMLEILLHEVNHAYTQAVADSVKWEDQYEDNHKLRMYADAYIFKNASEHYTAPEEDKEEYYNNALEVAAQEYTEEWVGKYIEYVDEIG